MKIRPLTIISETPGPGPGTVEILGRTYRTVVIDGREWLAENFVYDDGEGGVSQQDTYSWYNQEYVGHTCYYTWVAAMRVAALATGWHIPTATEWDSLIAYAGGAGSTDVMDNLCSAGTVWNSGPWSDTTGLGVLPFGYLNYAGSDPQFPGNMVSIWSSSQPDGSNAYKYQFDSDYSYKRTDGTDGICNVIRLIRDI